MTAAAMTAPSMRPVVVVVVVVAMATAVMVEGAVSTVTSGETAPVNAFVGAVR